MSSSMTPLFTEDDVERWFDHFQERANEKIFNLLSAAGEKFIEVARKSGSYHDQTGNLRSSIGYIIAIDGEVVSENFELSQKGTDRITGENKAHRLAGVISLSYKGGFVLIGVAGMNYATAVEARGCDVVSGANVKCDEYLRKALKSVFKRI